MQFARPWISRSLVTCCLLLCSGTIPVSSAPADESHSDLPAPVRLDQIPALSDPFGEPIDAAAQWQRPWHVMLLVGTECPLSRLYAEHLNRIAAEFPETSVDWTIVVSTSQDGPSDLQRFREELSLSIPLIRDGRQQLADSLRIERVPTAAILDHSGKVHYLGRVDDRFGIGIRRKTATREDMIEALRECLAGQPVSIPKTETVGCLISRPREPASSPTITFHQHIAGILDRRCVRCHRSGDIGPMSLSEYDEVIGWADMLVEVVQEGRMPPWHATDSPGHFINEAGMTDEEKQQLYDWVEQGLPEGDASLRPTPPQFADAWRLETPPDAIISLPADGFEIPATGTVDYRYAVVDPGWTEDRWIQAAQVLPGEPSVVHHAIVFTRSPETTRFDGLGWLAAFVPGQEPAVLPPGTARRIPAGSKLVFQMHYTPDGRPRRDVTRLGVWFADEKTVEREALTAMLVDTSFEIPPQTSHHEIEVQMSGWPDGSQLLALAPHMHYRGKSCFVDWVSASQTTQRLLTVPRYDFGWQHTYLLANPILLGSQDQLRFQAVFDNSANNPHNPDPNIHVRWGEQTWEEMAVAFVDLSLPRQAASQATFRMTRRGQVDPASRVESARRFLATYDANQDQFVDRSEVPESFAIFAFERSDQNQDGKLDLDELAAGDRR